MQGTWSPCLCSHVSASCESAPPVCCRPPISPPGAGEGGRDRQAVMLSRFLRYRVGDYAASAKAGCVRCLALLFCPVLTRSRRLGLQSQPSLPCRNHFIPRPGCATSIPQRIRHSKKAMPAGEMLLRPLPRFESESSGHPAPVGSLLGLDSFRRRSASVAVVGPS
jgi:hypothetical protein